MRIADDGRTCAIIMGLHIYLVSFLFSTFDRYAWFMAATIIVIIISMFAFGVRVAFHLIEEDTSLNANGWIKENDDE